MSFFMSRSDEDLIVNLYTSGWEQQEVANIVERPLATIRGALVRRKVRLRPRAGRKILTEDDIHAAYELHKKGFTYQEVADELNISIGAAFRRVCAAGRPRRTRSEVAKRAAAKMTPEQRREKALRSAQTRKEAA